MKEQYYLDLEKYSLQKFKKSLQKRDMIPSRVILKENIEERFKILGFNKIKNLKELVDVLKTKQKIESFAKKTNLSIEYLTILKREASSYLPNPINLKKFPGIDTQTIEALEKIGIKNTKQLYNKVNIGEDIIQLSQLTGISVEKLNELASLSDLARLYGVGPVFARIIYDVGIKSVKTFVRYKAEEFINIYENKTQKKADFSVNDINFSIELAKELKTSN
jgi:nucleotidyltransferase/DNA polymerase involved in DNA repair